MTGRTVRQGPGQTLWVYLSAFAMLLVAPLGLVAWGIRAMRARPIARSIREHAVSDVRVEGEHLVLVRRTGTKRERLEDFEQGIWILMDWGGSFAAANECGVLVDLPRRQGASLCFALERYEEPRHRPDLMDPLVQRGLLAPDALFVERPGKGSLMGLVVASTLWTVIVVAVVRAFGA